MNTPEIRTDTLPRRTFGPDRTQDPDPTHDPLCGTTSTPQCPARRVYEERNQLIYRLAGTRTDREGIQEATERVDDYLFGVLQSALELTGASIPENPKPALYELRNELIYQLAGTRTDLERIQEATERVDDYLFGVLQSALELMRPISD